VSSRACTLCARAGDDGTETALAGRSQFVKETDSTISLWCSGRAGTLGLLVQMKMIKRQDLISVISQLVRPRYDHVVGSVCAAECTRLCSGDSY
jgi:alanine-alpha-ketoisovalerate/valine-pyruvate aminotransferase